MSRNEAGPAGQGDKAAKQEEKALSKRNGAVWTAPGPIAGEDDAYKGTAAAHPVLVVVPQKPEPRTPEQIEAELDRTRADLERTLDELSVQLSPRNLVRRAGKGARARLVDPESGKPRRAVLAAAGGIVAVTAGAAVAVRALRRRRA